MADQIFGQLDFFDGGDQQGQGGSMRQSADDGISENPGRETPQQWMGPKDVREGKGSGDYPNYSSWKTRSGHSIIMDDSDGKESLTIQHRGGSALQFLPNGAVHMVSSQGNYQVVFGENRMTVTGAMDITCKGDHSFRTYGDVNHTHHGDYNLSVTGDHNITSRNMNRTVRGNMETIAQNETKKIEGNSAKQVGGAYSVAAKQSVGIASISDTVNIGAQSGIGLAVKKGNITAQVKEGHFLTDLTKGNFGMNIDQGNYDVKLAQGAMKNTVQGGGLDFNIEKNVAMTSTSGNMDLSTSKNFAASSGQRFSTTAGSSMHSDASQGYHTTAGQMIAADASTQYHQSGKAQKGQPAQQAQNANPDRPNPKAMGGKKTVAEKVPQRSWTDAQGTALA